MLQTGYLTLRLDQGRLRYDYPNNEVRLTFASSLLENFGRYATTDELEGLYQTLATEDYAGFCLRLNTFMAGMPGEKIVGETDCHLILHALCQLMRVEFQSEVHQLGGRSDLGVIFPGHVCVFEFKYNRSPEAALNQIEARDYGRRHFGSSRRVVAVGLNFIGGGPEEPPRIPGAGKKPIRGQFHLSSHLPLSAGFDARGDGVCTAITNGEVKYRTTATVVSEQVGVRSDELSQCSLPHAI